MKVKLGLNDKEDIIVEMSHPPQRLMYICHGEQVLRVISVEYDTKTGEYTAGCIPETVAGDHNPQLQ